MKNYEDVTKNILSLIDPNISKKFEGIDTGYLNCHNLVILDLSLRLSRLINISEKLIVKLDACKDCQRKRSEGENNV